MLFSSRGWVSDLARHRSLIWFSAKLVSLVSRKQKFLAHREWWPWRGAWDSSANSTNCLGWERRFLLLTLEFFSCTEKIWWMDADTDRVSANMMWCCKHYFRLFDLKNAWIDLANRQRRAFNSVFWQWPRTNEHQRSFLRRNFNEHLNCTLQHCGLESRVITSSNCFKTTFNQQAPKVKFVISFEPKKSVFTNRTAEIPRNVQKYFVAIFELFQLMLLWKCCRIFCWSN